MNDRHQLLEKLNSGRDEFLASLNGVTEEQAAAKPVTGWSILECAEHVAIVEENLLRRLLEQSTPTDREMPRQREALIVARAPDRGRKVPAPEAAGPPGRGGLLLGAGGGGGARSPPPRDPLPPGAPSPALADAIGSFC